MRAVHYDLPLILFWRTKETEQRDQPSFQRKEMIVSAVDHQYRGGNAGIKIDRIRVGQRTAGETATLQDQHFEAGSASAATFVVDSG